MIPRESSDRQPCEFPLHESANAQDPRNELSARHHITSISGFRRSSAAVATNREDHHSPRSGREVRHRRWGRVCKKRHSRSALIQKLTGIESNGPNENRCHFWFSLFAVAKACTHYRCRSQRLLGELRCHDVPHGTSCCGIFATLGEYFCPITLRGDFPVRMSQLDHVGGAPPLISSCKGDSKWRATYI